MHDGKSILDAIRSRLAELLPLKEEYDQLTEADKVLEEVDRKHPKVVPLRPQRLRNGRKIAQPTRPTPKPHAEPQTRARTGETACKRYGHHYNEQRRCNRCGRRKPGRAPAVTKPREEVRLRVLSSTTPPQSELRERRVAHVTQEG